MPGPLSRVSTHRPPAAYGLRLELGPSPTHPSHRFAGFEVPRRTPSVDPADHPRPAAYGSNL